MLDVGGWLTSLVNEFGLAKHSESRVYVAFNFLWSEGKTDPYDRTTQKIL